MIIHTTSEEETQQTGEKCASFITSYMEKRSCSVYIRLLGELGAGKTVFVKGFLAHFKIFPHAMSPTFVIMKHYKPQIESPVSSILHMDAYRLEEESNIDVFGIKDIKKEDKVIILAEWAENIIYNPQFPQINISFHHGEKVQQRKIEIKKPH